MSNLIRAELYKLRKSTQFKISMLVTAICAVMLAVIAHSSATGSDAINPGSATGLSDIFIMSVIGALMAGTVICNDFENKNIHDEMSCGRVAIVASKTIIYSIVIALLVLPYAVVAIVGFISGGEFAEMFGHSTYLSMIANTAEISVNASNIGKAVAVLLVSLLLYAARLSFCIPVAFGVRKSVIVTVIAVVFGFVIDLIMSGISKVPGLDKLVELMPFAYNKVAMSDSAGQLVKVSIISVVFIAFMGVVTYLMFKRAEIK